MKFGFDFRSIHNDVVNVCIEEASGFRQFQFLLLSKTATEETGLNSWCPRPVAPISRWTFGGQYGFIATMYLWWTVWVHCYDGPLVDSMGSLLRWTFGGQYGFIATMDLWWTVWVHCYDGPLEDSMGSLLRWTFGGQYGFIATMDLW